MWVSLAFHLKMLKRILIFIYFQLVGVIKIAKEQIYGRQRKLKSSGMVWVFDIDQ